MGGIWKTMCTKDLKNPDETATRICLDIGMAKGTVFDKGCAGYNGKNHCGMISTPIGLKSLDCGGVGSGFYDCQREMPDKDECTHEEDLIVECALAKKKKPPEDGALKLLDTSGSPTTTGVGMLSIFLKD